MGVGVDIGSKTIKIVELDRTQTGWVLKGSGIVGYRGKTVEYIEDEKELSSLAEIIKKLHKEARISKKDIAIALPEQLVFTRTVRFPLLTDQEIASAIKWEAEQYIPIPVTEAVVQHTILERNEKSTPPEVLVLLVAVAQTLVEKYIKLMQMAGLTVSVVETELIAITRALAPTDQVALLLDFGARSTDIAITKNANLVFSRSVPTAGDALTRAVAQSLSVEFQQAEEYKKTYGLSSEQLEGKVESAIAPVLKMVVDEIKKAIQYFQAEEKGDAPKSVIISGGSAGMPEVASFLTKTLNLEVVIGNPFAKVSVNPEAAKILVNYSPLYSIAVGLAER